MKKVKGHRGKSSEGFTPLWQARDVNFEEKVRVLSWNFTEGTCQGRWQFISLLILSLVVIYLSMSDFIWVFVDDRHRRDIKAQESDIPEHIPIKLLHCWQYGEPHKQKGINRILDIITPMHQNQNKQSISGNLWISQNNRTNLIQYLLVVIE